MPISGEQLKVEVRFLKELIDYHNYQYNGFKLKTAFEDYIRKYLSYTEI